jgi:hypothetical protein
MAPDVRRRFSRGRLSGIGCLMLALSLLSGCNLLLDNEKRSLAGESVGSIGMSDAMPAAPAADGGDDAGPDAAMTPSMCGGNTAPQCTPNAIDEDTGACGDCGAGTRTRQRGCSMECRWGSWSDWTECNAPADVCVPGTTQTNMESCGECNLGMRMTSRSCTSSCGWSDWMPGPCMEDEAVCHPGATMTGTPIACGDMCGHASQTQTCNASCAWSKVQSGMCVTEGVCKPGEMRMSTPGGCNSAYCNKGVQQRIETCTASCTWGPPTPTGSCTIPSGVCRPTDLGGKGYRCRANDNGFRDPCYPSTASADLACTYGPRQAFAGCPEQ